VLPASIPARSLLTAARSAAPAVAVGAGVLPVVFAAAIGGTDAAVVAATAAGDCIVGCALETTGADEAEVVEIAGESLPTGEGAAALWFREQPVTSIARIAMLAAATAGLEPVT